MEGKPSIEVDGTVGLAGRGHRDGGTQLVVARFEKGHDEVQPIGRPALEDRHKDFAFVAALSGRSHEPRGGQSDAGHRNGRRTKKDTSGDHRYLRWKSGDPITSVTRIEGVASLS